MGRGGASPGGTHPPATPPAGGSRQPADPVAATTQPAHPPPGHLPAQRVGDDLAGPAGHAEPPPVHGGAQLGHGARARASPVQLEQQHRPQQYAPDGQASRGLPVAPTHGVHRPGPVIEGAHAAIIADGCDIPGPPHHLLGENFHLWRASAEKLLTGPMAPGSRIPIARWFSPDRLEGSTRGFVALCRVELIPGNHPAPGTRSRSASERQP